MSIYILINSIWEYLLWKHCLISFYFCGFSFLTKSNISYLIKNNIMFYRLPDSWFSLQTFSSHYFEHFFCIYFPNVYPYYLLLHIFFIIIFISLYNFSGDYSTFFGLLKLFIILTYRGNSCSISLVSFNFLACCICCFLEKFRIILTISWMIKCFTLLVKRSHCPNFILFQCA